jgi:hypothetical protein
MMLLSSVPALILIVAMPMAACAQNLTGKVGTNLPTGWVQAPSRHQNPKLWNCAGFGESWVVRNDGGTVALTRFDPEAEKQPPIPPHVRLSKKMFGGRSVQSTSDGWLIGFDAGEFGGGLWWFNRVGSKSVKLLPDNVHAIYQASQGILILVGLNHMGLDYGEIYKYADASNAVVLLAKLDGSPEASTISADGGLIIATSHSVSRVDPSGRIDELYRTGEYLTYPTSVTVDGMGVVYVAMRFFVLRLIPQNGAYTAQWMIPEQCRSPKLENYVCSCTGEGTKPN